MDPVHVLDLFVVSSMGSRAPGTETDVLLDTPAHGPGRVTMDLSIQDMGTASRQLGSTDDVTLTGAGVLGYWRRSRRFCHQ